MSSLLSLKDLSCYNHNAKQKPPPSLAYPQAKPDELLVELEGKVPPPRTVSLGTSPPVGWTAVTRAGYASPLLRPNLSPGPADLPYPLGLMIGQSTEISGDFGGGRERAPVRARKQRVGLGWG